MSWDDFRPVALSPEERAVHRARQRSRAAITGVLLALLCLLFFAVTIVKIGAAT